MEKNSIKISFGTAISIFIIIILVILLAGVYYFGFIKETNNSKETEIPTSDLVTLYYEASEDGANIFYGYIEDGELYYFKDNAKANGINEGAYDFISSYITSSIENNSIKKYTGLNNIRRIKTYNFGASVNPVPLLVTEDGKVYIVNIFNEIEVEIYEVLKNYEIEDILNYNYNSYELESVFKILLKDGTIKTVTAEN